MTIENELCRDDEIFGLSVAEACLEDRLLFSDFFVNRLPCEKMGNGFLTLNILTISQAKSSNACQWSEVRRRLCPSGTNSEIGVGITTL